MDWFRVYSSILDKPNVCGLDADVLGYWLLFMAYANRATPRGTLPADAAELAWAIHRDPKQVAEMTDRLIAAGLLEREDGELRFHKWNLYQPPSTDRTSAHKRNAREQRGTSGNNGEPRERKREEREEKRREETPQPPACVSVEGSEPEPFVPPPAEAPPPLPPETRRMVDGVDKMLPGLGYGELCGQQGLDPDSAIGAAIELKTSGKTDWRYFGGIYKRLLRDKGNGKAPPKPAPKLECDRIHRAPRRPAP